MPSRVEELHRGARKALEAKADSVYMEELKKLVPAESIMIGVRVPVIRDLVKAFNRKHKDLTVDLACQLLDESCKQSCREEILFGVFLLARLSRKFDAGFLPSLWKRIDNWVDCINNWETCDQLAMNVAGEVVAMNLSLTDDLLKWTRSENKWRRRIAVASTVVLNQKGRRYAKETLTVCEALMREADPVVQKAVGWAIREATKSDENAVFVFLKRWKDKANRRIFREGSQKLSPDHKTALA